MCVMGHTMLRPHRFGSTAQVHVEPTLFDHLEPCTIPPDAPMRGIFFGVLFALPMWAAIFTLAWLALH